jgi:hypothetical protein
MEEILALVIVADDEAMCMMPPEALHYAGQLEFLKGSMSSSSSTALRVDGW